MATFGPSSAKGAKFMGTAVALSKFRQVVKQREIEAADKATATSKAKFHMGHVPRPLAPARYGRPTTDGLFTDFVKWIPNGRKKGFIDFDTAGLRGKAPYYLIQEIGTNKTAKILNPPGSVSIRSQIGRTIPFNLYWAPGMGGQATNARTGASGDQLYLAADLNAASLAKVRSRRKRIRREIKGRHYLQAGGVDGFSYLRTELVRDAQRIFK